jgi:hypothetical protein
MAVRYSSLYSFRTHHSTVASWGRCLATVTDSCYMLSSPSNGCICHHMKYIAPWPYAIAIQSSKFLAQNFKQSRPGNSGLRTYYPLSMAALRREYKSAIYSALWFSKESVWGAQQIVCKEWKKNVQNISVEKSQSTWQQCLWLHYLLCTTSLKRVLQWITTFKTRDMRGWTNFTLRWKEKLTKCFSRRSTPFNYIIL